MKNEILEYIRKKGGVSFVELSKCIEGFNGEYSWCSENVVLWINMNEEAINSLEELIIEEKIVMRPSNVLVYAIDGYMPSGRMLKKEKLTWAPIVFWTKGNALIRKNEKMDKRTIEWCKKGLKKEEQ